MQLAHTLLAEERVAGSGGHLVGIPRQATIQRRVVAHEVTFEGDPRGVVDLPAQYRRHTIALGFDVVTERITALTHHIQAIGKTALVIQGSRGIQRSALHALIIELTAQRHGRLGQRLFGNHVEGAARIAAAIKCGGRTAQHLKTLDGVGVRHVRITAIDREAIAVELAGGEAAHRKRGQPLTTEVVGSPDAARVVESILQTCGTDILDRFAGYDADRLRGFVQRGIGTRGTGRACGPITIDRPLCRFGIGGALDIDILQFHGRLDTSHLISPGRLRDSLDNAK